MANEVKLPRLGQGMEAGTIVKWLKSEGDQVEKGEPLYELDTDKVTQEVEADFSGVLLKIAVSEGEVPVGRTIAVIGEQGEEVEVEEGEAAEEVAEDEQEEGSPGEEREEERERGRRAEQATQTREPEPAPTAARGDGRIKASPLARRIARERGIDLAALSGTGPEGRIVAEDVERADVGAPAAPAAAPAAPTEVERVPLTSMRKTIARRLTEAWEAPVFQIAMTADMTSSLAVRERLVELYPEQKPTISDLLTRLTASALMRHRQLNAHFVDDEIQLHPTANVGIAVATDRGLVVPVHRSAERKTIAEIAAERADLVSRAREAKLQQADLEGGTFTISNLGMFGVERFIAVLNPPQVAILAVGAVTEQAVVEQGEVVVRPRMELTLTCDHRAVDGAVGAEFLRTLKGLVEQPALAL
jgi:pyruvate dehydrogenase E2 component (dihydrolipoamide acetyltransferase)